MIPQQARRLLALPAIALILVLAACAGLPTSGPVKLGRSVSEADEDPAVSFNPDKPSPGMTPQQVVEGFIAAGSGTRDTWAVAKLFLAEATPWNPRAGVTVYTPGQRTVTAVSDDEVNVAVRVEGSVEANGAYTQRAGEVVSLNFRLAKEEGEWRITEAPDGIVLDRNRFTSVFRNYPLMFFDRSWRYLVPDERWFPVDSARVRIAEALTLGGPSAWLAESVRNEFTESTGLGAPSVPVRSQVAEVPLRSAARGVDRTTLGRMQLQLAESLAGTGVQGVDMLVDGQSLGAVPAEVQQTRVETRPLVTWGDGFGFLSGAELEPLTGLGGALADVATEIGAVNAIEVDADRSHAAVRGDSGGVGLVQSDGRWQVLDTRAGLVKPTMDDDLFTYSVPAGDPAGLRAYSPDGTVHELSSAWPGVTHVYALRVSRDGTRLAAVVRDGTQPAVWISGIIRDDDGVPVRLSEPKALGALPGAGVDLTWLDGSTLAVLAESEGQPVVIEQPVGGPSRATRAPEGATSLAGGNESGEVRLLDSEGRLFGQRGATWSVIANDVGVLATQRGMPD